MVSFFQKPFNTLTYELIGDGSATSFFEINSEDGRITVSQDLRAENIEFYHVNKKKFLRLISSYTFYLKE